MFALRYEDRTQGLAGEELRVEGRRKDRKKRRIKRKRRRNIWDAEVMASSFVIRKSTTPKKSHKLVNQPSDMNKQEGGEEEQPRQR